MEAECDTIDPEHIPVSILVMQAECDSIDPEHIQGSPIITLCLGSIELDRVISEPCYKGIIL